MTEGQELAVQQLRAVQERSSGAFEVVEIGERLNSIGWLIVLVRVDCSGKEYRPGGVQLKRREWLKLVIPPDFPYQIPSAWTPHTRFAGLPHVQWKRHLCLYQAPSTEWNVNDGMFGYLARLDLWLDHAAAGELNPSGEPLHPPVAYLPAGPTRIVIPRVDAPSVGPANWIGFAKLANVSETRADITGWMTLAELGGDPPYAPAILLSEPMPYEFPAKMGDLLKELEPRGVSTGLIITALRFAVLCNREEDPLFVVLGTPMRGVAGSTERIFHLAAWYIEPGLVRGLRLSLNKFDPNPKLQEIGQEVEQIVIDWMKATDVGWCLVREDRPEIVIPRDRDSEVAWFRGKTVSVWGCGAIGSHVADYLARAGVRKLILRDKATVMPGIITRQLFTDDDIGKPKVEALAARLKAISPSLEIEEHTDDLLTGPLSAEDWTDNADVVIETTGAGTVMVKGEAARRRSVKRIAFVSMALGHEAKNAMMVVAGPRHSGGALDVDRKLRQECYSRPELHEYVEEFWPRESRREVFQPEPGCSDATFSGSCADVAQLTAAILNLAAQELKTPDLAAAAHLLSQPLLTPSKKPAHKRFSWPVDQVLEDLSSGYEVRIAHAAWGEMRGWIAANDRIRGMRVETGGLLFGERHDLTRTVWVDEVSGPPPDSSHSAMGFVCGVVGTAELAREQAERTAELVRFLGMWHTHPGGRPLPSPTDLNGVEDLVHATDTPNGKSLMLIVGGRASGQFDTAAYVFGREDLERIQGGGLTRLCSIHPSSLSIPPRNVGLALSGGGSRAIAFHLGCLRALHDRGILDRVQVISSVSGGSVIAALYAYSQGSFAEFDKSVVTLLRRGLQSAIVRRLAHPADAAKMAGTMAVASTAAFVADSSRAMASLLSSAVGLRGRRVIEFIDKVHPPFRRWQSATVAFEAVLRDRLFGSIPITAPRRADFDVVINACELRSGSAFRFGSRESGCWRYGAIQNNAVEVAHAVTASAAYPALLPALDEVLAFTDRNGVNRKRRVLLTDGGVYDNLGVTCLEPGFAGDVGYNRFTPEYIICCDAGQGIFKDNPVPYLWGPRMARAFESVFRKAQNATQNRLHLLREAEQVKGFVLAYLGQIDSRVPYAPPDLVKREQVFEYPTDFAAMRSENIDRLANRGEQLTRALISYYCPEL
jgi:integrative and conjugative element protein (TIGR02256 family)